MSLWVAEYEGEEEAVAAILALRERGVRRIDACSPWPVMALEGALELPRSSAPLWALLGALVLASTLFLIMWWTAAVGYPVDVGGRPLFPIPALVPITAEMVFLGGSFGAFLGGLALGRMPRPWHPLFEVEGFDRASRDRLVVVVDDRDPRFEQAHVQEVFRDALVVRRWEGT